MSHELFDQNESRKVAAAKKQKEFYNSNFKSPKELVGSPELSSLPKCNIISWRDNAVTEGSKSVVDRPTDRQIGMSASKIQKAEPRFDISFKPTDKASLSAWEKFTALLALVKICMFFFSVAET